MHLEHDALEINETRLDEELPNFKSKVYAVVVSNAAHYVEFESVLPKYQLNVRREVHRSVKNLIKWNFKGISVNPYSQLPTLIHSIFTGNPCPIYCIC